MESKYNALHVLFSAFGISSFGGLAALLRSDRDITVRMVVSAMLNSGILGLVIALFWYNYYEGKGNIYFLLGVSGLAGIGGMSILDLAVEMLNGRFGLTINIRRGKKSDASPEDDDRSAGS